MNQLATKSTHKKPNYKTTKVAEKLDTLVNGVVKRGVFVVDKNDIGTYDLLNYLTKQVVLTGVPTRESADKLCAHYNKGKYPSSTLFKEISNMIDKYENLLSDCAHYVAVIRNSKCNDTAEVADMRRNFAIAQMNKIKEDFSRII